MDFDLPTARHMGLELEKALGGFLCHVVIHNPLIFWVYRVSQHVACGLVCWDGGCPRQVLPLLCSRHPPPGGCKVLRILA